MRDREELSEEKYGFGDSVQFRGFLSSDFRGKSREMRNGG
jgi:hypothetical protein